MTFFSIPKMLAAVCIIPPQAIHLWTPRICVWRDISKKNQVLCLPCLHYMLVPLEGSR